MILINILHSSQAMRYETCEGMRDSRFDPMQDAEEECDPGGDPRRPAHDGGRVDVGRARDGVRAGHEIETRVRPGGMGGSGGSGGSGGMGGRRGAAGGALFAAQALVPRNLERLDIEFHRWLIDRAAHGR